MAHADDDANATAEEMYVMLWRIYCVFEWVHLWRAVEPLLMITGLTPLNSPTASDDRT